jgi:hypothetical protein
MSRRVLKRRISLRCCAAGGNDTGIEKLDDHQPAPPLSFDFLGLMTLPLRTGVLFAVVSLH